jgi:hypothetical protein
MKNVFLAILSLIAFLAITTGLLFYFGVVGNVFDATVGKQQMDIQRQNFKHSNSYIESQVEDIANYKLQYEQAKSQQDKDAIRSYIVSKYANFNPNQIENPSVRQFLLQMMESGN